MNSYPLRILKQALVHLVGCSQSGLSHQRPEIKDLLLNREKTLESVPFRIGLYIRANKGARSSGLACGVNLERESVELFSEFSFWPLGWLLAFDNMPLDGATDVTSWGYEGYHDKRSIEITVPCQWAIRPYPKDFRSL